MIYLVSDLHGGESLSGLREYLSACRPDDLLIVLGDVGLCFEDTPENRRFTDFFLSLEVNVAFLDGNHENHPYLNSFPVERWQGGLVHRLSEHVVHLMRGNVYTIRGKTLFVMGGCKSSPKWKQMGLWYPGEEPSEAELALAHESLRFHQNKVDYILTHKYSPEEAKEAPDESLEGLMRVIDQSVRFRHWYSGHWHQERVLDDKHTVVYDRLVSLED